MGGSVHRSQRATLAALTALALRADTSVPVPASDRPAAVPVLVVNPHLHRFRDHLELECCLDYRPIPAYRGRAAEIPMEVS